MNWTGLYFCFILSDCLVQAGADVNLEDKNEETPFYLCVQIGCESLLNYLIRCENLNVIEYSSLSS